MRTSDEALALAKCQECPYNGFPMVKGSGSETPKLVFIGEAPGVLESIKGEPFVGTSGQVLDKATGEKLGLTPEEIYKTYSVMCRPPGNENPVPEALRCCKPRMDRELTEVMQSDSVLVPLGNFALQQLKGYPVKITQERGKSFDHQSWRVVPTFHPANLFHNPGNYRYFIGDLRYATELARGAKARKPKDIHYRVISSPDELDKAFKFIAKYKDLAADIETSGFDSLVDYVLCLGIAVSEDKVVIFEGDLLRDPLLREKWRKFFADTSFRFILHNGKFDTKFLRALGFEARVDEDTMLRQYSLDESRGGKSLKDLAAILLGAGDYDRPLEEYKKAHKIKSYSEIPKEILHPYLAKDCAYTYGIFLVLIKDMKRDKDLEMMYQKILIPTSEMVRDVEMAGIPIDVEYLTTLEHELRTGQQFGVETLEKEFQGQAGYWGVPYINPRSPAQISNLLYDRMKLKTPKGYKRDTRKATLEAIAETLPHGSAEQRLILKKIEYAAAQKIHSTYAVGLLAATHVDGRLHPDMIIIGTQTGRLASKDPNVQNIPRSNTPLGKMIRRAVRAPNGKILVECDYGQAELRVLAHVSDDPFLKNVYRTGKDLHNEVSLDMYGPDYTEEQRVRAKAVNFGIAYGRTAFTIALEFDIPVREAQDMIDKWFASKPGAKAYMDRCLDAVKTGKTLKTCFGRKRRFGLIMKENFREILNQAKNFEIQSTANDLTLLSAIKINNWLKKEFPDGSVKIINLIHDSILFEMPSIPAIIRRVTAFAIHTMKTTAEEELKCDFPFEADSKIGYTWGDMTKMPSLKALQHPLVEQWMEAA